MRRAHSKVSKLPPRLLDAIHEAITKSRLTYDDLAERVELWVEEGRLAPEDAPSRSGLARYGKHYLARMEQLNIVREQAKQIVASAGGEGLVLEEAAVNLVLNEIMAIFMQADPERGLDPSDVAKIAMGLGRLQSSSTQREKLKVDLAKRAKEAVEKVTETARQGGLSAEAIATIEREVLGIVR